MRRVLLVSLLMVTALLAASAGRAQMMGPGMGPSSGFFSNGTTRGTGMLTAPRDMSAVARAWLDALHAELGIAAQQESAWLVFSNAVLDQADDMQAFRAQMAQLATATAPQRAALLLQHMDDRRAAAADLVAAMASLYDALTPAQRALLDTRFAGACGAGGVFGD